MHYGMFFLQDQIKKCLEVFFMFQAAIITIKLKLNDSNLICACGFTMFLEPQNNIAGEMYSSINILLDVMPADVLLHHLSGASYCQVSAVSITREVSVD